MQIGQLPTQLCGVSQLKESATLLSIGLLIQLGVPILRPQTKLCILTARIHRRPDRTTWKLNIFGPYLTRFLLRRCASSLQCRPYQDTPLIDQLDAALRQAGIGKSIFGEKYSVYSLRHFYAVNSLQNGVGVFEVARILGLGSNHSGVLRQASYRSYGCDKVGG
jgi:hypothetical protein